MNHVGLDELFHSRLVILHVMTKTKSDTGVVTTLVPLADESLEYFGSNQGAGVDPPVGEKVFDKQ